MHVHLESNGRSHTAASIDPEMMRLKQEMEQTFLDVIQQQRRTITTLAVACAINSVGIITLAAGVIIGSIS